MLEINVMETIEFANKSNEDSFLEQFYQEHLETFRLKQIHEIIECFNREVGCNGWTGTRGAYLNALSDAFKERDLFLDETVFLQNGLSIRRKIKLEGNKIIPID